MTINFTSIRSARLAYTEIITNGDAKHVRRPRTQYSSVVLERAGLIHLANCTTTHR